MNVHVIEKCIQNAKDIRKDIVEMTWNAKAGHLGGSMSCVEIIASLCAILNIDPKNPLSPDRDRFILSKGQATMTFYSAYKQLGFIKEEELKTFKQPETFLYANLMLNEEKGIENSNGSLAQNLPYALGIALGLKRRKNIKSRVFCLMGDGECNEGAIWEAALFASHNKLDNLTVIIDKNGLQYDGNTSEIISMEPLDAKWQSFGWEVENINGHDVSENLNALEKRYNKPNVIVANTIKGKGVSFAENNPDWHAGSFTKEQYEQAKKEQEEK